MGCGAQSKRLSEPKVIKGSDRNDEHDSTDSKNLKSNEPRSFMEQIDRFTANSLEWTVTGFDGILKIAQTAVNLPKCSISETADKIQTAQELKGADGMDKVNKELKIACIDGDIIHLLRAYTIESAFYKLLNKNLAKYLNPLHTADFFNIGAAIQTGTYIKSQVDWPIYVVSAVLAYAKTPNRSPKPFIGRTYRGMKITKEDLSNYHLNSLLIQKTFTSTSKQRSVAEGFIGKCEADLKPVICTYVLDSYLGNFSIDLQKISYYPDEAEVLIPSMGLFIITKIDQTSGSDIVQIELSLLTDERVEDLDLHMDNLEVDDRVMKAIMNRALERLGK